MTTFSPSLADAIREDHTRWAILCGPTARDYLERSDVYGPFDSIDEANDYLVEHRSACPVTDQAWRDDHDVADEAHDIVEMLA